LPPGMDFVIDRNYMLDTFTDIETSRANQLYAERDVFLTREQYISLLDIIAYTLNDRISIRRLQGAQVGRQEFGHLKGVPISQSLIGLANKIVNKMSTDIRSDIGIQDLIHIIRYLYHSGFLFVDLKTNENEKQNSDRIMHELGLTRTFADLEQLLKKYTFSVISPLIYTRLMVDLEDIAGRLCDETAPFGMIYELTVKSEAIYQKGYDIYHDSHKYTLPLIEVDLYENGLLLEATICHKADREHSVDKVFLDCALIRILTDLPGTWEFNDIYYRIGYPKALLMLSNNSIHNLKSTKITMEEQGKNGSEPFDNPV